MRRSHLVLAVLLVAVVALCVSGWVNEGPLWGLVMTKNILVDGATGFEAADIIPISFGTPVVLRPSSYPMRLFEHPVYGWYKVKRWARSSGPVGRSTLYFQNGLKAVEYQFEDGILLRCTHWNFDGTVLLQRVNYYSIDGTIKERTAPPWLWDVTDQTEPTAPWWNEKDK